MVDDFTVEFIVVRPHLAGGLFPEHPTVLYSVHCVVSGEQ